MTEEERVKRLGEHNVIMFEQIKKLNEELSEVRSINACLTRENRVMTNNFIDQKDSIIKLQEKIIYLLEEYVINDS